MAIITDKQSLGVADPVALPEPTAPVAEQEESSILDTVASNLYQHNVVTGAYKFFTQESMTNEVDKEFTFDDWSANIKGFEDDIPLFSGIRNKDDMDRMKRKITERDMHKDILRKANPYVDAVAKVSSFVADPLIFVPIVGTISKASKAGAAAQGFVQGAAIEATAQTAREAVFQATDIDRTAEESIENVMVGGVIGGMLGGVVGALTPAMRASTRATVKAALKNEDIPLKAGDNFEPQVDLSVGAAKTKNQEDLDELAALNKTMVKAFSGLGTEALLPAAIRGTFSKFGAAREWTQKLFPPAAKLNKHFEGIASGDTIQEVGRRTSAELSILRNDIDNLYLDYLGTNSRFKAAFARPAGTMSRAEFEESMWPLLIGAVDEVPVPQINKAAEKYRKVLDATASDLQKAGLLPENLATTTARKYLMRVYDTGKMLDPAIRANMIGKISRWVSKHNKDGSLRATPMDAVDADAAALKIYDNILSEGDEAFQANSFVRDVTTGGKFDKSRSLLMPDEELEPILVKDIGTMIGSYIQRAKSSVALKKALEEAGFESMADLKTSIKLEKDELLRQFSKSGDAAERAKIQQEFDILLGKGGQQGILDQMTQAAMGTLQKRNTADRFFAAVQQYQFMRLLGNVTVSSLGELAMVPFKFGFKDTLTEGYLPMIRSLKTSKLAKDQLADLDIGVELLNDDIIRTLAHSDTQLAGRMTETERMLNTATGVFGKLSGIGYFTSFGRRLAGQVGSAHITRLLKKFSKTGSLDKLEIAELAELGIGKESYEGILKHIDQYAVRHKGSFITNIHMWPQDEATEAFRLAIQRTADSAILKPGAGDLPLFVQRSGVGRILFQFKSFSSAATHKIFYSALQRKDATTVAGLMLLVSLGALSKQLKDTIAGREPSEDLDQILIDGVSASGLLGLIASSTLDLSTSLTDPKRRRYFGETLSGTFLGPSASEISEIGDVIARMTDGEVTDKDIHKSMRLLPFMNLFYINAAINKAFKEEKSK